MTKKDFIALADAIIQHDTGGGMPFKSHFTSDQLDTLAHFCKQQNPRFKVSLWLDYVAGKCGPNGGKVK